MRRPASHPLPHHRSGFTLVELMIVVVIIATLIGLLLPAVSSIMTNARNAEVVTEIRGLEGAIANFKSVYGIEPPSRIRLYETAAGWSTPHMGSFTDPVTGGTITHESERVRSVALMNRLFPNFNYAGMANTDFNGDGSNTFVDLTGAECLVFFLGGLPTGPTGGPYAMTGFSKNPANPFTAAAGNESREGPFFEFKPSRLKLSPKTAARGMLTYIDPRPSQLVPYVYASSYDGRGYQLPDLYVGSANDLNDVYRTATGGTAAVAQKAKSFQIISAGADGLFGAGGYFATTATNHGLTDKADYDNITNFHNGPLSR